MPEPAARLMQAAGEKDFFRSPTWFSAAERHLLTKRAQALYLVAIEQSTNSAVALLPLALEANGREARIGSLTSPYSVRYGFIGDPSDPRMASALRQLAKSLDKYAPDWATIRLNYLPADDPATAMLESAFADAGLATQRFAQSYNWRYQLNGQGAEEYFSSRPGQLRSTITRRRKRLSQAGGYAIHIGRDAAQIDADIDKFRTVYESSWKDAEISPAFVADVVRDAAREGRAIVGILFAGDRPAAGQIWFIDDRRATIYKLAYDPAFAEYSPGTLLTEAIARDVIERDKVEILDFGFGDEPFKRDWMNEKQPVIGLIIINTTHWRGKLRAYFERIKNRLKTLFRKATA